MKNIMLIIDGNSLVHRAYWALPQMNDAEKRPTNAVFGFFTMFFRIVEEYKPTHIAVAFDAHQKTFRHEAFAEYKSGRRKTPSDLNEQFPILKDALSLAGVKYIDCPGFEADDIIGTLSKHNGMHSYIFTGDRDELQLITNRTEVILTKKGVTETKRMDKSALEQELGIAPIQIPDLKGLMGDASDNIPGVPGVGEKTALKLLHEYGTIENLYENLDNLPKNKLFEKLEAGKPLAFMSKELATINCYAPINVTPEDFVFNGFNMDGLRAMFKKYSFKNFIKRFDMDNVSTIESKIEVNIINANLEDLKILGDVSEFSFYMDSGSFCFAIDINSEYHIPIKTSLTNSGYTTADIINKIRPYFNKKQRIIAHDIKSYMHQFIPYGLEIITFFDIMLAAWVLNPSLGKYDLETVLKRADLSVGAAQILRLAAIQKQQLKENGLTSLYNNIELPIVHVLFNMEQYGFYVSAKELRVLGEEYDLKLDALTDKIYNCAGERFNIGSTKQLAYILFEKFGLPVIKKTKTGFSTDIEVLEKLVDKHPIILDIIEYRTLSKLKNTYIDGLLNMEHEGYIHTTFLQTNTATGRLSSTEPNLQNIPIRSPMASEIRKAFLAPEGMTIISADYSQIELRILADIANDENLRIAFLNGEDIHARTAAEILDKPINEITSQERSQAKAINFGIVYGISDYGLSKNTGITRKEAAKYIDKYLQEFSGVRDYMKHIKDNAREQGEVRTLFGRLRYVPEIKSGNFNIRSAGERIALNTPIQGTAADIIKIAMISAFKELNPFNARLVLQVHDELIVYAPDNYVEEVKAIIKNCMEHAAQLSVPLVVNVSSGKTWQEAK